MILQNFPQLPHVSDANSTLVCAHCQSQEVEWEEKQENECLVLLRNNLHYARINCIHVFLDGFDKLINLSFLKAEVFPGLKRSMHSEAVSQFQQTTDLCSQTQLPSVLRTQGKRYGKSIVWKLVGVTRAAV